MKSALETRLSGVEIRLEVALNFPSPVKRRTGQDTWIYPRKR